MRSGSGADVTGDTVSPVDGTSGAAVLSSGVFGPAADVTVPSGFVPAVVVSVSPLPKLHPESTVKITAQSSSSETRERILLIIMTVLSATQKYSENDDKLIDRPCNVALRNIGSVRYNYTTVLRTSQSFVLPQANKNYFLRIARAIAATAP